MCETPITTALVLNALKPLFAEPVRELAALMTDEVRLWRWGRQLKIVDRARKILEERGIEPKPIHLKVLVPLLDAASLEDEPMLEEMWARLLASASEDNTEKSFHFICTEILKNISSHEAKVLDRMYSKWKEKESEDDNAGYVFLEIIKSEDIDIPKSRFIVDNLKRLNLADMESPAVDYEDLIVKQPWFNRDKIYLTHLGIAFMKTMTPSQRAKPTGSNPTGSGNMSGS